LISLRISDNYEVLRLAIVSLLLLVPVSQAFPTAHRSLRVKYQVSHPFILLVVMPVTFLDEHMGILLF
jgi:hypothetical protein